MNLQPPVLSIGIFFYIVGQAIVIWIGNSSPLSSSQGHDVLNTLSYTLLFFFLVTALESEHIPGKGTLNYILENT